MELGVGGMCLYRVVWTEDVPHITIPTLDVDSLSKDAHHLNFEQELTGEDDNIAPLLQSGASHFHLCVCSKSEAP